MLSDSDKARLPDIIEDFQRVYYNDWDRTWENTRWHGHKILKCPLDLWVYQEIIWEQEPDLIIETGTAHGGSALWFAHMLDLVGHGNVVSIDICGPKFFPDRPKHPRIRYITDSSTDPEVFEEVADWVYADTPNPVKNVLVVLDSDHRAPHVLAELEMWSDLVSIGGYIIVEDGNVNGHPVIPEHGPGPTEAIAEFLDRQASLGRGDFIIDTSKEKFMMTFNPGGYLRRVQ